MPETPFDQAEEWLRSWGTPPPGPVLRDFILGKALGAPEIRELSEYCRTIPFHHDDLHIVWMIRLESLLQDLFARLDAIETKLRT